MTEKEFHKMKAQDLVKLLLAQGEEASKLQEELNQKIEALVSLQEYNESLKVKLDERDARTEELKKDLDESDACIRGLEAEIAELKANQWIELEEAGTLKDAARQIRRVFEEAQREAEQYLYSGAYNKEAADPNPTARYDDVRRKNGKKGAKDARKKDGKWASGKADTAESRKSMPGGNNIIDIRKKMVKNQPSYADIDVIEAFGQKEGLEAQEESEAGIKPGTDRAAKVASEGTDVDLEARKKAEVIPADTEHNLDTEREAEANVKLEDEARVQPEVESWRDIPIGEPEESSWREDKTAEEPESESWREERADSGIDNLGQIKTGASEEGQSQKKGFIRGLKRSLASRKDAKKSKRD